MKVFSLFAVLAAGIIAASAAGLMLLFPSAADHEALELAAIVAYAVHLGSFVAARLLKRHSVLGAWYVGSLMRVVTLVVYGVMAAKALALPMAPSLIGCATFLFLPTLIEPLLLLK